MERNDWHCMERNGWHSLERYSQEELTKEEIDKSESIIMSAEKRSLREKDQIVLAQAYINKDELKKAEKALDQVSDQEYAEEKKQLNDRVKIRTEFERYKSLKPAQLTEGHADRFIAILNPEKMTKSDMQEASSILYTMKEKSPEISRRINPVLENMSRSIEKID